MLLNGLALQRGRGGVSTYVEELVAALRGLADPERIRVRVERHLASSVHGVSVAGWPRLGSTARVLGSLVGGSCSVFHGLDGALPVGRRGPSVVTVHDVSVFDRPAGPRRRTAARRALLRHAVHAADRVIAVSSFTASRVAERFGRDATVVPLAPRRLFRPASTDDIAAVRVRYGLPDEFVLALVSGDGRKDATRVAELGRRSEVAVVTVGPDLYGAARPGRPSGTTGSTGSTGPAEHHLGFVPTGDLRALYSGAAAFVYLSHYEGFGLPPFEALACGTPVVASPVGALPDLLGGLEGAVSFVDDTEQALAAVGALLADPAHASASMDAGQRRLGELSWQATAEATLGIYRELGADL